MDQHLISEGASETTRNEYKAKVHANRDWSVSQRRALADQYTKTPVFWSWDIPRTREGFYHYQAGEEAAIKRSTNFAPYADMLWVETGDPSVATAARFSGEVRQQFPGKKFVYNLSPSFNWMAQGFDEKSLKSFIWDLAQHG